MHRRCPTRTVLNHGSRLTVMAALIAVTAFAAGAAGPPPDAAAGAAGRRRAAVAPAAAAAATVSVSDGTLGISDGAGTNTLLTVASEAGLGGPLREDAEGVVGATRVLSFSHAFGPGLGFWSGLGPVAGAGCEPVAGDTGAKPGPHLACHPVRRIDLELGSGDDFAYVHTPDVSPPGACLGSPCSVPVPTRIDGGAGDDGLEFVSSLENEGTLEGGPGNDSIVFKG